MVKASPTCEECGAATKVYVSSCKAKRFCSRKCSCRFKRRNREGHYGTTVKNCPVCGDIGGKNCPNAMCKWMLGRFVPTFCKVCNAAFQPRMRGKAYRSPGTGSYCSAACRGLARRNPCTACNRPRCGCGPRSSVHWVECGTCRVTFASQSEAKVYCSARCRSQRKTQSGNITCKECGCEHYASHSAGVRQFCSDRCARNWWRKQQRRKYGHGDKNHRKRARRYGVEYEPVSMKKLLARDGWRCQCCGVRVRRTKDSTKDCYPNLDHIVPMSKGGGHTWSNVQVLCRRCNMKKGNNMALATQLRLHIT